MCSMFSKVENSPSFQNLHPNIIFPSHFRNSQNPKLKRQIKNINSTEDPPKLEIPQFRNSQKFDIPHNIRPNFKTSPKCKTSRKFHFFKIQIPTTFQSSEPNTNPPKQKSPKHKCCFLCYDRMTISCVYIYLYRIHISHIIERRSRRKSENSVEFYRKPYENRMKPYEKRMNGT